MSLLEAIARLGMAALLSGLVGFEREAAQKAAGLRTHILVGLGAALFGILSIAGFLTPGQTNPTDPSRVAAQVVTGIGFLGAGAIFREGRLVRGLTTAAGLWTVAAIGLAAGAGLYSIAAAAAAVTLIVLYALRYVDRMVRRRHEESAVPFEVRVTEFSLVGGVLAAASQVMEEPVEDIHYSTTDAGGVVLRFDAEPEHLEDLIALLATLEGVDSAGRAD